MNWWKEHGQGSPGADTESLEAKETTEDDIAEKARSREEKLVAWEDARVALVSAAQSQTAAAAEYERVAVEAAVAEEDTGR